MFSPLRLTHYGTVGHCLLGRDEAHGAVPLLGHEYHSLALDAADGAGLKVGEDADLLADHLFGGVVFGYARDYYAFTALRMWRFLSLNDPHDLAKILSLKRK